MTVRLAFIVAAAHAALKAHAARINELNVYPVPDGDTGTNMLLTLESILKETSGRSYDSVEAAVKAGARAALMGARGNSGVILSQMIRGACEVLARRTTFTAEDFAAALEGAERRAYASIRQPVEGTMLTVIRDAARAAREALKEKGADLPTVIRAAAREAHASVRRTPQLLGVLREAGVVDAGGLGVAVILDGLYACVTGKRVEEEPAGEEGGAPDLEAIHAAEEAWGYCTEFFVNGFSGDPQELEEWMHGAGKSVLVVADEDLVKVHLHTQDPGEALSYAARYGRLSGVKVEDMEAQVRSRGGVPERDLAVVVVSRGEGNREMFEAMGAFVVEGGQGANPSAADLLRAVERSGAREVILLPNNKNIIPTAEQVAGMSEVRVHVLPTTTIAAGLAAMVGYDPEGEPEEVVGEMREIVEGLRCAEITRAVRAARVDGREVPEGAFIGLLDGRLSAVGGSVEEVAVQVCRRLVDEGAELITLLCGEGLEEEELGRLLEGVRGLGEGLEVEVKRGGQPLYPLQVVAE